MSTTKKLYTVSLSPDEVEKAQKIMKVLNKKTPTYKETLSAICNNAVIAFVNLNSHLLKRKK